jgi:hypothetical protein
MFFEKQGNRFRHKFAIAITEDEIYEAHNINIGWLEEKVYLFLHVGAELRST